MNVPNTGYKYIIVIVLIYCKYYYHNKCNNILNLNIKIIQIAEISKGFHDCKYIIYNRLM